MEILTEQELIESMTCIFMGAQRMYDLAHEAYEAMDIDVGAVYAKRFQYALGAWRKVVFWPSADEVPTGFVGEWAFANRDGDGHVRYAHRYPGS